MSDLSVIILTFNEERHIKRCLDSLKPFTDQVLIVDSFSTDHTLDIARDWGATVIQNPFINHATQVNFGIKHNPFKTAWVMRMDADEYVLPELSAEITAKIAGLPTTMGGIYVKRRVIFMDHWIRHGGYYPTWLLRIWRQGQGICEQIWMDEHIKLTAGTSIRFTHDIVDHNLNNLTWWTQKHNNYAILEVISLLNTRYNFDNNERIKPRLFGSQEQRKRFLKERYVSLPLFTRPLLYFLYRYVFKLGFLDGRRGFVWHFLQGLWYRTLVDAKILEIERKTGKNREVIIEFFQSEYGKDLSGGVQ